MLFKEYPRPNKIQISDRIFSTAFAKPTISISVTENCHLPCTFTMCSLTSHFQQKHFSPHITHHISSTHVKFLHSLYHHTVPTQYDFFLTIFPPADLSLSLSPSLSHPFTSLILSPMGVVLELSPC